MQKLLLSLLVLTVVPSASTSAFAQAEGRIPHHNHREPLEPGGAYIRERNQGDLEAMKYRDAFFLSVCNSFYQETCLLPAARSTVHADIPACIEAVKNCDLPTVIVDTRFLSKYGIGEVSAVRDVLPDIRRVSRLLAEMRDWHLGDRRTLPASVEARVAYVANVAKKTRDEVRADARKFLDSFRLDQSMQFKLDYWGYFHQFWATRHAFEYESSSLKTILIAYRFCSGKHRFVSEGASILGDVVATALYGEKGFTQKPLEKYAAICEALPDESGDYEGKSPSQNPPRQSAMRN